MDRLALFPDTVSIQDDRLTLAGLDLADLAREHGTPLYLYDRATMDNAVAAYAEALSAHYPAPWGVTYAGKAFLNLAVAQWARQSGLWLDCTGEGEIAIAIAAHLEQESILVHGVNKSAADLESALRQAGTLVVDHLSELEQIAALAPQFESLPELWLRLQPGIAVDTHHAHTQTGQYDSKFGMTREEWLAAAEFCKACGLPLTGIHFHQGSNFRNPEPLLPAIDLALGLAAQVGFSDGWHFCPGGGWGMAYHEDELPNPPIAEYVRGVAEAVIEGCRLRGLGLPHLHLEPGRSLIARAGVALYRVGGRKRRGDHTWLLTDGGLADNPRFALYGARYSALTVTGLGREWVERVHLAGPYCESGDVILKDLRLPRVEAGEWVAVPMSGAYQLSMSGNYNGARRPAVLWLEGGRARLIQRRETLADLLARDAGL